MNQSKKAFISLSILLVLVGLATAVTAQNDPGHDSLYILRDGDTVDEPINFTNNIFVPVPTSSSHAATKGYVDTQIESNITQIEEDSGNITGTGSAGQVTFWIGDEEIGGSNDLYWDSTNNRLGIGTTDPDYSLEVQGEADFSGGVRVPMPTTGVHAASKDYVDQQIEGNVTEVESNATQDLADVLGEGDDAGGLNIQNVGSLEAEIIEGHNDDYGIYVEEGQNTTIGYIAGLD